MHIKRLVLLLLVSSIAYGATRIEVMRFGTEIQDTILEKGERETFYYNDGIVIGVKLIEENTEGATVQLTAAVGSADFADYTQHVSWNGLLTIAEPKSGDIITLTFAQNA